MSYPPPMGPENRGWPPAPGAVPRPEFATGDAITYGWNKFKDNAGWWILLVVIYGAVSLLLSIPGGISTGFSTTNEDVPVGEMIGFGSAIDIVFTLISWAAGIVFAIASIKGALLELDGRKPQLPDFFKVDNWGPVVLAALLVTVLTSILPIVIFGGAFAIGFATDSVGLGLLVFLIGLVVLLVLAFLTYFTLPFAIDKRLGPVQAVRSSVQLISKNAGPLFVLALAATGIIIAGALACLVGLLVAMPLTTIASTYAYRVLTHGTVSPATPAYPQYPQTPYPPQQPYGGGFPQQSSGGFPPQAYGGGSGFPPQTTYGGNFPPAEPPYPQQPPYPSAPPQSPDSPNPWQPPPGGGFPPDKP